jgi:hypothetical protein
VVDAGDMGEGEGDFRRGIAPLKCTWFGYAVFVSVLVAVGIEVVMLAFDSKHKDLDRDSENLL